MNTAEAAKDKAARNQTLGRLYTELERIAAAHAKAPTVRGTATSARAQARADAELSGHTRTECALRDHVTLGRWLRQTCTGRLLIDRAKVAAEERLDGKHLLPTSDPYLSPTEVALGYKNPLEAEHGFRDMKSTLMLRPVFHRLEPRIRPTCSSAASPCCWSRVAENATAETGDRIAREMHRLAAVTLTGPAGTVVQATNPTDTHRAFLSACNVAIPPRPPYTTADLGKRRLSLDPPSGFCGCSDQGG